MHPRENEQFATLISPGSAPALTPYWVYQGADEATEGKLPLAQYLWILRRNRWRILGFVVVCLLATVITTAKLTPIYESTATVDIDRQTPSGVVGEEALRIASTDSDQFLATQIKLVESDAVLRPVEQQFQLRMKERQSIPATARGEDAPIVFKRLKVVRPPNTYLMLISYRSTDPQTAADAANAIAQSYLERTFDIRLRSSASLSAFMERQLEELKAKMERSSQALANFERELNVVNPEEKTNILAARLLQLNTEFTNAQTERLRRQASYQSLSGGSMEAALSAQQGESLRKLAEHLNEVRERFQEVQTRFGLNHPEYRKARAQMEEVERSIAAERLAIVGRAEVEFQESGRREQLAQDATLDAKAEFDRVNAKSFAYQALKREAETDRNLYEELIRKIKEAGINAGFQNNAVRIVDSARPGLRPVSPNLVLNVSLALLFSMLIAVSAAVLTDVLDKTVKDPEQVARTLRTEVIGSLPRMKRSPRLTMKELAPGVSASEEIDTSGFGESIRTLRNSILLAGGDRRCRSILVTSAAPGEGKTTTAANLASAHAQQGKRTLLIDGDLRRPSVHRNFNLPSVVGLSNVLVSEIPWRDAVIRVDGEDDLYILAAGPPTRRASDLVGRGLTEVLEEAAGEFDLVILDAPPLLGFAEPLQMATAVDGVIVVARAGQTTRKAVASVLATLHRLRAKVIGVVLNEVHKELSDSYYYYGSYRSYYRSTSRAELKS